MSTYNIKLYAHGVPNGQDIWGAPKADAKYIETFYGRRSCVPSQMLVEVMQFGSETNAYYTYLRSDNFQDKSGRPGGYFALTLCINYYYADVQNIYNLLEAAFNKYIVGTIVEQTQGGFRFVTLQLSQANSQLTALEKELEHYLMQFSTNADFISLAGFKTNGQNECGNVSLLEASPAIVAKQVKATGKISVSPLYRTTREIKAEDEINAVKTNAQQQIDSITQNVQNDKEEAIEAIKNKYKNVDLTISNLRSELATANNQIKRLNSQVQEHKQEILALKDYKTKYEKLLSDADKSSVNLARIKKTLVDLCSTLDLQGQSFGSSKYSSESHNHSKSSNSSGFMGFIKDLHPFVDFFVMVVLVAIVGFTIPKSCTKSTDADLTNQLKTAHETITNLKEQLERYQSVGETKADNLANEIFAKTIKNTRIVVTNVNNYSPMKVNKVYTVSLRNNGQEVRDLGGEWSSDDFTVDGNNITPKHKGSCKIEYVINDIPVLSETFDVQ